MVELVVQYGIKFRRYPGRHYFSPHHADRARGVEDLHREVWKRERGDIPPGWHVHHGDGDPSNNDIDNLECLPPHGHHDRHSADRAALGRTPEFLDRLAEIRVLAARWHGSPEGLAWHAEHGRSTWIDRVPKRKPCEQCGAEFEFYTAARFCSNACKSAWRRTDGIDNEERSCEFCGAQFTINRYAKTRTCTRSCAARMRWAARRNVEPGRR